MTIRPHLGASLLLAFFPILGVPALGGQEPIPLDHDVYEIWRTIGSPAISADGAWVLYTLELEDGDGELWVRQVDTEVEHRIPRGANPAFAPESDFVVVSIRPHLEASRDARREERPPAERPRDSLAVLELATGNMVRIPEVRSFQLSGEGPARLAYQLHPARDETPEEDTEEAEATQGASSAQGTLVLRELATGREERFPDVTGYTLAESGELLLFSYEPQGEDAAPGVRAWIPGSGEPVTLWAGPGSYGQLTVDREGREAAFLHAPEAEEGGPPPEHHLRHWRVGDPASREAVGSATAGVPSGWWVGEHGSLSFSRSGERLYFGTAPRPEAAPEPGAGLLPEEEVELEVWHWQDGELMSVQRVREEEERRRTYRAVLHLDEDRVVQLADEEMRTVSVHDEGDGSLAVGATTGPYAIMSSWEWPNFSDVYLVDVGTGERERAVEKTRGTPSLSPEGRFLYWWENADSTWYVRETATGQVRDVSSDLPHPVYDEDHDSPSPAGSYGSGGWLEDDSTLLLYDRHDVWAVDPRGEAAPRSLTGEEGRAEGLRFRLIRLDREARSWQPGQQALLSAFHTETKDAGFYRTRLDGAGPPEPLLLEARLFSTPEKAEEADRLLFTQETFREFPDLWVADTELRGRSRISRANPQQEEYRWGNAELVEWTSADGIPLRGLLLTPDGLDPERKYPMIVYFYDRASDGLHRHYAPVPHRSIINFPMYTSHDYVVFIPDIVYRIGYPGESAVNAINPGVLRLVEEGFVDRERIGLQGHSWAGYQIAFMVTRSRDLYRAAAGGAPVANMTSAYGGIRRETGLVRQFQYERTQSRLGGSLWEMPLRYLENSPLFWVDKIETPLLIMHNDGDGHVPWEQGIELFVALRRLGKPAWMINYNGEPHWPTTFPKRRDWNIRMKQFFDHFLKDAPPPVWMVEGLPAVRRGETLGLELVEGASAVDEGH